jgi:hypothetical protein
MRTINNLNYPTGLAELDEFVPLNIILNEHESFQLCHSEVDVNRSFFIIMRILNSEKSKENPLIYILKELEFMVITSRWSGYKLFFDFKDGNDPIFSIENKGDSDYHKMELNNFQINLKKIERENIIPEDDNELFLKEKVFKYNKPIEFNTATQRLHFRVHIEGEDYIPVGNAGNMNGRTCQTKGAIGIG